MVVNDLNFECLSLFEFKAQSPLLANANAPLPAAIGRKLFEVIGRRLSKVLQFGCRIQLQKPHRCSGQNIGWQMPGFPSVKKSSVCLSAKVLIMVIVNYLFTIVNR